jgi:hypothetical protein
VELLPGPEAGVALLWSDVNPGGEPWARLLSYSPSGKLVADRRVAYCHGPPSSAPVTGWS